MDVALNSATPAAKQPRPLRHWWLGRSVRAKGLIVVAVPLVALLGVASASLVLQYNERQERTSGRAASALTSAAGQILTDAMNAETGVRGYMATSDSLFLEPYDQASARIAGDQRNLRNDARTEGDVRQQQAIAATAARAFSELTQIRAAVGRGVPMASLKPTLVNEKATVDSLRRALAGIDRAPTVLLATRVSKINGLESAIDTLNIAGLVLGLLAGLAGIALFTSGVSSRVAAAADNANRLGEGQPLRPVAPSGDELGRLASSLTRAEHLLDTRASELVAAKDAALQATQAKNAFLANTSHELRTPLNSILGFAQLLEISELPEEDRDSVERILGAGRHLLALINELIDIARIEAGELSLSVEPVLLYPLVKQAVLLMEPLAADRSIAITQHGEVPRLAVFADRRRMSQVLVNLISNAVKYNHRGGSIMVTCQEKGDSEVAIVIADTGPGLTGDDLERVFLPFERLGAEQTGTEGTGIGLPLARALAEAMGAHLSATSVPGEGSAFSVVLPRAPDMDGESVPDAGAPAAPPDPALAAISVLYIEDNPANIEVVSRYLRGRPDTTLCSVTSGQAGIEHAHNARPDLILLDLHLADIHGEEVLTELRAEPSTAAIPVVILSAEAGTSTVRRLLCKGAVAYLTKPLDLAELGDLLDARASGRSPFGPRERPAGQRDGPSS
jgi:signal transduction histidine kinase/ActR/RegA family two-component response regulator